MSKFNPCTDYCYVRHNKQYSDDCIETCDYAQAVLELKKCKDNYEKLKKKYKELSDLIELETDDGK